MNTPTFIPHFTLKTSPKKIRDYPTDDKNSNTQTKIKHRSLEKLSQFGWCFMAYQPLQVIHAKSYFEIYLSIYLSIYLYIYIYVCVCVCVCVCVISKHIVCLVRFGFFVKWHINLCTLFNAKAIIQEEQ